MTVPDPAEDAIRAALGEIADDDRRSAPPFARVVADRARPSPRSRVTLGRLAAAAGIVLVAGAALMHLGRAGITPVEVTAGVEALTAWRSNSDVLLLQSSVDVSSLEPDLHASVLDTLATLADPSPR